MHTDARTLEDGHLLEADLCIVGAGAAGISIAREWIGGARTVLLLEGGGFDYDAQMQDLYRGESVGLPYYPLQAARLHQFGGTTGHWAGFCSTYDALDFERRAWVPHSGWPITRASLDPYYARAQRVLELGPYEYDAAQWQRRNPSLVPFPLDARAVWTKMWQFSPPTRFGTRYLVRFIMATVRAEVLIYERYGQHRISRLRALWRFLVSVLALPVLLLRPDGWREAIFVLAARLAVLLGPQPVAQTAVRAVTAPDAGDPMRAAAASMSRVGRDA